MFHVWADMAWIRHGVDTVPESPVDGASVTSEERVGVSGIQDGSSDAATGQSSAWLDRQEDGDRRGDERGGSPPALEAKEEEETVALSDIRIATKHIDFKEVTSDSSVSLPREHNEPIFESKTHTNPVTSIAGDFAKSKENKISLEILNEPKGSVSGIVDSKSLLGTKSLKSIDEDEPTGKDDISSVNVTPYHDNISVDEVNKGSSSRSMCDELRKLSRVNTMVEQGSLANIRGSHNHISEDGNRSQSTETVSERRGTHIARLIQSKSVSLMGEKPIYPNVPFSPYGSPSSSPGLKRRPLKECRRVSIETNGDYTQLNQYKLKQAIGQVSQTKLHMVVNINE